MYGDTTFTEFTDGLLTEHVKSVSVCDTEMVSKGRQVNDLFAIMQLNSVTDQESKIYVFEGVLLLIEGDSSRETYCTQ